MQAVSASSCEDRAGSAGRQAAALGALVLAGALLACGGEPQSPESQVRALFERAETAAEARDASTLHDMISIRYADERGQDERALKALVGFHLLRNESIHLLTRTVGVEMIAPGQAEAVVIAAMAGKPIPGPEALALVRADLYRFGFSLEQEDDGEWRLVRAEWERAKSEDFL